MWNKAKTKKALYALIAVAFWLGVWALCAHITGLELLLPTPWRVAERLFELALTEKYWLAVGWSILRIGAGFLGGTVLAAVSALAASRSQLFDAVFSPFVRVIRATPVASVIILAWVWFGGKLVPALAVGLMVLPVVYEQTLTGIRAVDPSLLEMARLYRLSPTKRIRAVIFPSVRPYFVSACMTALGLGWKAGVAAEVIAHPIDALGTGIYESKIYLEMPDLFAYTVTVVAISVLLEKLIRALAERRKSRGRA